jgi:hypothetical protein
MKTAGLVREENNVSSFWKWLLELGLMQCACVSVNINKYRKTDWHGWT